MSRPLDTDLEDYHAKYSNVLVFLTDTKRQLKYRGQLFLTEDKNTIFFLQAPIITDLTSLENQGILFTDFSLTDPVLDYLIMVQSHKELLEKSQKLNKQLERYKHRRSLSAHPVPLKKETISRTRLLRLRWESIG